MTSSKTIIVATHRRSGTHWTIDALRNNSLDINSKFLTLEQTEPSHHQPIPLEEFQNMLESLEGRVLLKIHDLPSATYWKNEHTRQFARAMLLSPTIYVYRDGRDVMVSLYYYMKRFREDFTDLSFSDFLRMDNELDGDTNMSRPAFWAHHIRTWLKQPNLISIAYESLETDYEDTVEKLADFLNIDLTYPLQSVNVHQTKANKSRVNQLLKKVGLKREKTSTAVSPRKGKSGDWRNHFSEDDLAFFMGEVGELMWRLGYVRDEKLDNDALSHHKDMWESPNKWVLAPVPSWADKEKWYGNIQISPFKKRPLDYTEFLIRANMAELIVQKMIEAGVEILNEIPNLTLEQAYEQMWTDRKDEFVLCRIRGVGSYRPYHKILGEIVHVYNEYLDWCVDNMRKAGVEIWSDCPEN